MLGFRCWAGQARGRHGAPSEAGGAPGWDLGGDVLGSDRLCFDVHGLGVCSPKCARRAGLEGLEPSGERKVAGGGACLCEEMNWSQFQP